MGIDERPDVGVLVPSTRRLMTDLSQQIRGIVVGKRWNGKQKYG